MSNDFSSPNFDTSFLLHTTSTYFCLLSIFYLEENQKVFLLDEYITS